MAHFLLRSAGPALPADTSRSSDSSPDLSGPNAAVIPPDIFQGEVKSAVNRTVARRSLLRRAGASEPLQSAASALQRTHFCLLLHTFFVVGLINEHVRFWNNSEVLIVGNDISRRC